MIIFQTGFVLHTLQCKDTYIQEGKCFLYRIYNTRCWYLFKNDSALAYMCIAYSQNFFAKNSTCCRVEPDAHRGAAAAATPRGGATTSCLTDPPVWVYQIVDTRVGE